MAFWWVNHKQTFKQEIGGGYIWSPKTKANGGINQTYTNLTFVSPGDCVISYADGEIRAIGVATDRYREQNKPTEFGKTGDVWSGVGWAVPIAWERLLEPLRPKAHLDRIVPLLPGKYSPLQANGDGNQGCYLASISDELGSLLLQLIGRDDAFFEVALGEDIRVAEEDQAEVTIQLQTMDITEKEQLVKARRGQGQFRQNVESLELRCRVTGVAIKPLLIASHIKPWRVCSNAERLDGCNGLLLAPHVDKLFDQGLISFSDDGEVLYTHEEIRGVLQAWGITLPLNVGSLNSRQASYMAYHRSEVFGRE